MRIIAFAIMSDACAPLVGRRCDEIEQHYADLMQDSYGRVFQEREKLLAEAADSEANGEFGRAGDHYSLAGTKSLRLGGGPDFEIAAKSFARAASCYQEHGNPGLAKENRRDARSIQRGDLVKRARFVLDNKVARLLERDSE